jgi:hypothetical protein
MDGSLNVQRWINDGSFAVNGLRCGCCLQDGTREGEGVRTEMHAWLEQALAKCGAPYITVHGAPLERVQVGDKPDPAAAAAAEADTQEQNPAGPCILRVRGG